MERWQNRVAVVTGATSGIGEAIAKDLVNAGLQVVALGRRLDRLIENRAEVPKELQRNYHVKRCDVSKESDIVTAFDWIEKNLGGTDILINNAGVSTLSPLVEVDSESVHQVLDTNVKGLVLCTREAFKSMKKRNFDGHIIHINSVLGHNVIDTGPEGPTLNVYAPSKYAVTAINEVIRNELRKKGTKIKTTSISPGPVKTEFIPKEMWDVIPVALNPEDISQAVLYVIATPPHVQIHEVTVRTVGEPF